MKLEDLTPDAAVRGVLSDTAVTLVSVQWHGSDALTLVYRGPDGRVADEILYRHDESRLEIVQVGRPWSFDGDGALYRLVAEANRIRLAHLFDPVLAVHPSLVGPLPHQITAVYEAMLPRQPLRFLLADDPGAGKTIMAGLVIKELIARGDLKRCLVVCPGSLAAMAGRAAPTLPPAVRDPDRRQARGRAVSHGDGEQPHPEVHDPDVRKRVRRAACSAARDRADPEPTRPDSPPRQPWLDFSSSMMDFTPSWERPRLP